MIGKAPRLTSIWWIQQSFAQNLEQIWIQGKAWRQSCWKDGRHKWSKAGSYWSYWAFILCWTLARYQTRYIRHMAQKYLLIQVWKVFLYLLLQCNGCPVCVVVFVVIVIIVIVKYYCSCIHYLLLPWLPCLCCSSNIILPMLFCLLVFSACYFQVFLHEQ